MWSGTPASIWATRYREVSTAERAYRSAARRASAQLLSEAEMLRDYETTKDAQMRTGMARLDAFERCRAKLDAKWATRRPARILTREQNIMIDEIRNAMLLPMFNGDSREVLKHGDVLHRRYGIDVSQVTDLVVIISGRRSGKTATVTRCLSCGLLSQDMGNVLNANKNQRQAEQWFVEAEISCNMMNVDPEFGWRGKSKRKGNCLEIIPDYPNDGLPNITRSLISIGGGGTESSADGNRGQGNEVYVMNIDEGLFLHDKAYEVLVPMGANGCAMIFTSSMPPAGRVAVGIVEVRYPWGAKVARLVNFRRMCDSCARLEQTLRKELRCPHVPQSHMHMRTVMNDLRMKLMLSIFGDSYEREIQSTLAAQLARPVYDAKLIDEALGPDAPRVTQFLVPVREFHVSVDPGSTMNKSDTGIVSMCYCTAIEIRRNGGTTTSGEMTETLSSPNRNYCTVRPRWSLPGTAAALLRRERSGSCAARACRCWT